MFYVHVLLFTLYYNIHIVYFDHIHVSSNSPHIHSTSHLPTFVFSHSPTLFRNLSIELMLAK